MSDQPKCAKCSKEILNGSLFVRGADGLGGTMQVYHQACSDDPQARARIMNPARAWAIANYIGKIGNAD